MRAGLTAREQDYCHSIQRKDEALRDFLERHDLRGCNSAHEWLGYLNGIKSALGNLNNDLSFVATLLAKNYLKKRFGVSSFDAAAKPQGAAGIDIEAVAESGETIVGELKTTKPYQPNFGAEQRKSMIKDLARLATSAADFRFMFVIDKDAFSALCKPGFTLRAPGIEIVNLATGEGFDCKRTGV